MIMVSLRLMLTFQNKINFKKFQKSIDKNSKT